MHPPSDAADAARRAGEATSLTFVHSLFRFQGAAARRHRIRPFRPGELRADTRPRNARVAGVSLTVRSLGASVSIRVRGARPKPVHPWAEGDPMVGARVGQVGTLGFSPMGRANSKSRKQKGHQPSITTTGQVGSKPELAHDGKLERAAVMDVMGMGGFDGGAKRRRSSSSAR